MQQAAATAGEQSEATEPPEPLGRLLRFVTPTSGAERRGIAVDLAGGTGTGALYLAAQGFDAALVDVSDVALALAHRTAADQNLELRSLRLDLEGLELGAVLQRVTADGVFDDPPNARADDIDPSSAEPSTVSLVTCFHYLNRPLLRSVADGLPVGAVFVASIATETNLDRNPRPSARFLLAPGELEELVCGSADTGSRSGLELLHLAEGWTKAGTHEAEIVVRRPD